MSQKPTSFDMNSRTDEKAAKRQSPQALDLSDVELASEAVETLDDMRSEDDSVPDKSRAFGWTGLFFASLGSLIVLAIGLAIDNLIRDLFSRHEWLGFLGLGLTALVVITLLVLVLSEILAIFRLAKIGRLRERAEQAFETDNRSEADKVARALITLYADQPETAKARGELASHADTIMDGRDMISLIERDLLGPLDARAKTLVMNASKRVAIVTAVSPRALIDILYVLTENLRLIRSISALYGGRPGALGFVRLTRGVIRNLAVTGALSIGDGLVQQVIGHGLAARLSARLGEGVVNGLLTARIGLAAHDICRPVPFLSTRRPSISAYMSALSGLDGRQRGE